MSGCNWGQEVSPFVVQAIGKQRMVTGPRYDINGKFMKTLESKGSLAYVHRIELGSGHLLHLFGLV